MWGWVWFSYIRLARKMCNFEFEGLLHIIIIMNPIIKKIVLFFFHIASSDNITSV